jgi:cytolysin (calcineurin-like family phosphatase)
MLVALDGCNWGDVAALDPASLPPVSVVLQPGTDVTFFVAADTHFGHAGIAAINARQVQAMNSLAGTPWPKSCGGGTVRTPLGVIIAGDLTDSGGGGEWDEFAEHYGLTGAGGPLKYPVFEGTGNHDRHRLIYRPVLDRVKARHGGSLLYSWNWGDVHVVCLDLYPDAAALRWLRRDLAAVDRAAPVVIFFHYSILGPFSQWWSDREREAFAEAIQGYHVVALFHGHYHGSEHYTWRGYDVYNVGSPRHGTHSFAAVHITDDTLTVGSWNYDFGDWDWSHRKSLALPER